MSPGTVFERPGTHITQTSGTCEKAIQDHLNLRGLIRAYRVILMLLVNLHVY